MSQIHVDALHSESGSNSNIELDNSRNTTCKGNLTVDGNIAVTGTGLTDTKSFRNLIINGAMEIDQRNGGSSITPTVDNTYTLDRFKARLNVASKYSIQKVTDAPSGLYSSFKVTSAAATTPGTNDYYQINHGIEGYNVQPLDLGLATAKQFTLSFWVKSSLTGTFGGAYSNNSGDRFYAWTYTISSADTWEKKSITITGATDGSWLKTNGAGLFVYWTLGAGSGVQTSAGSWGTSFKRGPSGATDVVATSGATWQITGVQLEVGDSATDFEHKKYSDELKDCRRYFYKEVSINPWGNAGYKSSTDIMGVKEFPVSMRAAPTTTGDSFAIRIDGGGQLQSSSSGTLSATRTSEECVQWRMSGFSSLSSGDGLYTCAVWTGSVTFDAEL